MFNTIHSEQLLHHNVKTTFFSADNFPLKLERKAVVNRFLPEKIAASAKLNPKGFQRYPGPFLV